MAEPNPRCLLEVPKMFVNSHVIGPTFFLLQAQLPEELTQLGLSWIVITLRWQPAVLAASKTPNSRSLGDFNEQQFVE